MDTVFQREFDPNGPTPYEIGIHEDDADEIRHHVTEPYSSSDPPKHFSPPSKAPISPPSGSNKVKSFYLTTEGTGDTTPPNLVAVEWRDKDGETLLSLTGIEIAADDFLDAITSTSASDLYEFWVSLMVGDVTVTGQAGDDPFLEVGSGGTATIDSGKGDDHAFIWNPKTVVFNAGKGVDTIEFGHFLGGGSGAPGQDLVVDLRDGTGVNPWGGTLDLDSVENVIGLFGRSNNLRGDDKANLLYGGVEADQLRGYAGDDEIHVHYFAGAGAQGTYADGGKGTDTLDVILSSTDFSGPTWFNTLDLVDPSNNRGTFKNGTFKNFEVIRVEAQQFGVVDERFEFRGSDAAEKVYGQIGRDTLDGGLGIDTLTGRGGVDRFEFKNKPNSKANYDKLPDFAHDVDVIVLKASVFKGIGSSLSAAEFHKGASAANGGDRIIYDKTTGRLFHDEDGKGGKGQVMFAILTKKPGLDAGDFDMV